MLQEVLPELYCGHDAFLFSSQYEAWGMPVLEAMAAGLAVVATSCLGVDTFARHGMNALLAPPQVFLYMLGLVLGSNNLKLLHNNSWRAPFWDDASPAAIILSLNFNLDAGQALQQLP